MRFRFAPRSMTLNDLKLLGVVGLSRDFADLGVKTAK